MEAATVDGEPSIGHGDPLGVAFDAILYGVGLSCFGFAVDPTYARPAVGLGGGDGAGGLGYVDGPALDMVVGIDVDDERTREVDAFAFEVGIHGAASRTEFATLHQHAFEVDLVRHISHHAAPGTSMADVPTWPERAKYRSISCEATICHI